MDAEIFIDGVKYISSSRAVEKTGYNQDYIGQLCRAKKVQAKLMGRTWFVREASLLEYGEKQQAHKGFLEKIIVGKDNVPTQKIEDFLVSKIRFEAPLAGELSSRMAFVTMVVLTLIILVQTFLFWTVAPEQVSKVAEAFGRETHNQAVETETFLSGVTEVASIPVFATALLVKQTIALGPSIFETLTASVSNSIATTLSVGNVVSAHISAQSVPVAHYFGGKIISISHGILKTPTTILNTLSAIPWVILSVTEKSFEISSANIREISVGAFRVVASGFGSLFLEDYLHARFVVLQINRVSTINIVIAKNIYNSLSQVSTIFGEKFGEIFLAGNFMLKTTTDGLSHLTLRAMSPLENIVAILSRATQSARHVSLTPVASVRYGAERVFLLQKDLERDWSLFGNNIFGGAQLISSQIAMAMSRATDSVSIALGDFADHSYKNALAISSISMNVIAQSQTITRGISLYGHEMLLGAVGNASDAQTNLVAEAHRVITTASKLESATSDGLVSIFSWTSQNLLSGWDTLRRSTAQLVRQSISLVFNIFTPSTEQSPSPEGGFVILPRDSQASAQETIRRIQNSFSDEVHVTESSDGTSGVVTPVFRSGQGQEYIYVLVPIKKNEKDN